MLFFGSLHYTRLCMQCFSALYYTHVCMQCFGALYHTHTASTPTQLSCVMS